jgi:hypothetical protein
MRLANISSHYIESISHDALTFTFQFKRLSAIKQVILDNIAVTSITIFPRLWCPFSCVYQSYPVASIVHQRQVQYLYNKAGNPDPAQTGETDIRFV